VITKRHIAELRRAVASAPAPLLSLYVRVNPAHPANNPQAIKLRVKNTLKELGVPDEVASRVVRYFEGRVHQARTLALFADAGALRTVELEVDLPVVDPATGQVDARWGAPYLTPLLLAMDDYERYAVLQLDRDRCRAFEVFMGGITELASETRPHSPAEIDQLETSKRIHPAHIADRGSAARDDADDHVSAIQQRFYGDVGQRLQALLPEREIDRIILLGPEADTHLFASLLPDTLAKRVVAVLPSLPRPDASPHEILSRVSPVIEESEARAETALLDQIRERGVWGLAPCLRALQEGQLHLLAAPAPLDGTVYRDPETGYVAATEAEVTALRPNASASPRPVPLGDAVLALAENAGARIDFVRGDRRHRLHDELGGLGGLRRW
jgi:hypothetical protein